MLWKDDFTVIDLPGVVDINQDKGGINSRGDIVGVYCDVCTVSHRPCGHPWLFAQRGDLTTIDFPGALSTIAFAINARREIVGWYFDAKGEAHGFLLSGRDAMTPTDEMTTRND